MSESVTTKDALFAVSPLETRYQEKYQDRPRMELLGLLNFPFRDVLEIGCGSGATARAIRDRFPGISYVGLEIDAQAADDAREVMDRVLTGNIEHMQLEHYDLRKDSIDVVILADVLEHLYDPWNVLRKLHPYLRSGGRVIASVPNVRNIRLVHNLVNGYWTYTSQGLLDATHVRFFTLLEIGRLFVGSGYLIEEVMSNLDADMPREGPWPRDVDLGRLVLRNMSQDDVQQMFTFQYLIRAAKKPATGEGGQG